jgi:poly-gamma-glutamate capsule biosynthesis protein CapA/YwtB (metallophosphatase superfamily)
VLLGKVAAPLTEPDLMVVNLEGTLGTRGVPKCQRSTIRDCHAFQAPPRYAGAVFAAAGVDLVNLANNHSNDFGAQGRTDTRQALSGAGIATTGGEGELRVVHRGGLRVAVVGFAPYGWGSDFRDKAQVTSLMRRATASADVVVAVLHLGAEGPGAQHTPNATEWHLGEDRGNPRVLAHHLVDAGADLVVGSGPHVVRGMEAYRGKLVAYSLGNLVGYAGAFRTGGPLSLSGILHVRLRADGSTLGARLVPLVIGRDGTPRVDPEGAALDRVRSLSEQDFGLAAVQVSGDGELRLPAVP